MNSLENSTFVENCKLLENRMSTELDELTDKLLELSMKLKAKERELEAIRERHDKELSKFSHNIKNPVGVISSFSEMLHGSPSMDSEKQAKYLNIIQSSSKFSLALVNSFQEYSKLQNGSVSFEKEAANYTLLVQDVIADFEVLAVSRNQSIEYAIKGSFEMNCEIDVAQIKNVLSTILDNALRYSEENSVVTVEVYNDETSITTRVKDTGIGISEKDLPKLTQTFFTVNTYDAYKEKCIGLGLAKSKIILQEIGGTLSFSSELEKGTQATIVLKN